MSVDDAKQQSSLDDTLKESVYYMEDTSEYNKSNRDAFKEYLRRHQDELRNKRNFRKGNFTSPTFKLSPVSGNFKHVVKHAHPNLNHNYTPLEKWLKEQKKEQTSKPVKWQQTAQQKNEKTEDEVLMEQLKKEISKLDSEIFRLEQQYTASRKKCDFVSVKLLCMRMTYGSE
ncbi:hypothetical protein RMATCC62417_11097 [Rhizopus microsporus]|nr:hypothetical protein RMATCC62417_11097 [Rhizopus microsporus]